MQIGFLRYCHFQLLSVMHAGARADRETTLVGATY